MTKKFKLFWVGVAGVVLTLAGLLMIFKQPPVAVQEISHSAQKVKEEFPVAPQGLNLGYQVPILMYHYVGNNPNPADRQRDILSITSDKFDAQLAWLAQNGYSPITLDTLYSVFSGKTPRPQKTVVLTFDDGYIDFYTTAAPILAKYSFPSVAFIPTGLVGGGYYMNWSQIKELQANGLVSFQAHTVHHYNLVSLPYSQQLAELRDSKKTLEAETGTIVNFIAYPYGASDNNTGKAVLQVGFIGGVGTWYGRAADPGINMPRIRISGNISLEEFITKVRN